MKKTVIIAMLSIILTSNVGFAQPQTGSGARSGKTAAGDNFAWGLAIGGLAALGTAGGLSSLLRLPTPHRILIRGSCRKLGFVT